MTKILFVWLGAIVASNALAIESQRLLVARYQTETGVRNLISVSQAWRSLGSLNEEVDLELNKLSASDINGQLKTYRCDVKGNVIPAFLPMNRPDNNLGIPNFFGAYSLKDCVQTNE